MFIFSAPENLTISDVTFNSFSINFTTDATASQYHVEVVAMHNSSDVLTQSITEFNLPLAVSIFNKTTLAHVRNLKLKLF